MSPLNLKRNQSILLSILLAGLMFVIIPAVLFANSQEGISQLTTTPGGETLPTRTPVLTPLGWMPVVLNESAPPPTPTLEPTVTPVATTNSCNPLPNPMIDANDATVEAELVSEINSYRGSNSLPAYTVNDQLVQAARRHAMNMASLDLNSGGDPHQGTDGSSAAQRIAESCYAGSRGTEIVGWGFNSVTSMMEGFWKTSAVHNGLLLDTERDQFGPAYMNLPGTQYTHYWTVTMGSSIPISRDVPAYQCTYTIEDAATNSGMSISTWQETPCSE